MTASVLFGSGPRHRRSCAWYTFYLLGLRFFFFSVGYIDERDIESFSFLGHAWASWLIYCLVSLSPRENIISARSRDYRKDASLCTHSHGPKIYKYTKRSVYMKFLPTELPRTRTMIILWAASLSKPYSSRGEQSTYLQ